MTLVERLCTELLTSKTHQTSIKPSSGVHILAAVKRWLCTKLLTSKTHQKHIKPSSGADILSMQ